MLPHLLLGRNAKKNYNTAMQKDVYYVGRLGFSGHVTVIVGITNTVLEGPFINVDQN